MAAAAFDEDAQADRIFLFHEELPNLLFSRWRYCDHALLLFLVGGHGRHTLTDSGIEAAIATKSVFTQVRFSARGKGRLVKIAQTIPFSVPGLPLA